MRTDLDHLPAAKQREIERVVRLVFEEFDDALVLAKQASAPIRQRRSLLKSSRP